MPMKGQVKFLHPQSISGVLQQNSIAAFSQTTEEGGDLCQRLKTNKQKPIKLIAVLQKCFEEETSPDFPLARGECTVFHFG